MTEPKHVFIGLTEVAGYYGNLASGIADLGIKVTFVDLSGNPYGYRTDLVKPRWIQTIESLLRKIRGGTGIGVTPRKIAWALARLILKIPVGAWALVRCNVFIFGFRTHFAAHHELRLIRLLGKRSVFIFNGSDTRPPYLSGRHVPQEGPIDGRQLARRARRMKAAMRRIERRADVIVNHHPSAHLHERPFVPWLWVGIPYSVQESPTSPAEAPSGAVRIVHAPTSPASKGTPLIRAAINDVRQRGTEIEYVELIGQSNAQVLSEIAAADFVVDETYSDTPMAGLGTEAASLARPTIVGGYDLEVVYENAPSGCAPPAFICRPEELTDAIETLARGPVRRQALGSEARRFVAERWAPKIVAARVLAAAAGEIPEDVLQAAHPNPYLHGWGLPEKQARAAIRAVVAARGAAALQIDHPVTRAALLAFAGLDADGLSIS